MSPIMGRCRPRSWPRIYSSIRCPTRTAGPIQPSSTWSYPIRAWATSPEANTTLNGGNGPDVVDGFAGNDTVQGGNGPDVLIGGIGDKLTGGNGPDVFLFREHFGANTITDFDKNDSIQFDKSIFASGADILAHHATDTAAGVVISDGLGDTVTLLGVHVSQLSAGTFLLA